MDLTTAQAAQLVGLSPEAFRQAVKRSPELQEARTMLDARTPVYDREKVLQWKAKRPGKGRRTDLMRGLLVAGGLCLVASLSPSAPADAASSPAPCVSAVTHYQAAVGAPVLAGLAASADGVTEANVLRVGLEGYRILARLPICTTSA